MNHIYIRTYIFDHEARQPKPWRIYEGLLLKNGDKQSRVCFINQNDSMQIELIEHISKRNSAHAWVFASEFDLLYQSEREDWESRHCWREAWDDAQRIQKELRGNNDN